MPWVKNTVETNVLEMDIPERIFESVQWRARSSVPDGSFMHKGWLCVYARFEPNDWKKYSGITLSGIEYRMATSWFRAGWEIVVLDWVETPDFGVPNMFYCIMRKKPKEWGERGVYKDAIR